MEEVWKDILGLHGVYKISNKGRVKSFYSSIDGKFLKPNKTKNGRNVIIKGKNYSIMRLVAREHLFYSYGDARMRLKSYKKVRGELNISTENITLFQKSVKVEYLKRYKNELLKICENNNLFLEDEVLSCRRNKYIQKCRAECYLHLYRKGVKLEIIGKIFNRNHAAVIYILNKHYSKEYKELVDKYK